MSFDDASLRFMESISITFLLFIGLTSPLQRNGGRENFAVSVISAWPAYPSKSTSGETDGAQFLEIFVRGGCFAGFTSPEKGRMTTSASSATGGSGSVSDPSESHGNPNAETGYLIGEGMERDGYSDWRPSSASE